MARHTFRTCENPLCGKTYSPHPNAKRAKYCSQKCSQASYRQRLKQDKLAKHKTVTLEQAIGYEYLENIAPTMTEHVDHFGQVFGHDLCLAVIRVIGEIGLLIKEAQTCTDATTI